MASAEQEVTKIMAQLKELKEEYDKNSDIQSANLMENGEIHCLRTYLLSRLRFLMPKLKKCVPLFHHFPDSPLRRQLEANQEPSLAHEVCPVNPGERVVRTCSDPGVPGKDAVKSSVVIQINNSYHTESEHANEGKLGILETTVNQFRQRKINFTENQISIIIQLHLKEQMPNFTKNFAESDFYRSGKDMALFQKEREMFHEAWGRKSDEARHAKIKLNENTPISMEEVDAKNRNIKEMCKNLTVKQYKNLVGKESRIDKRTEEICRDRMKRFKESCKLTSVEAWRGRDGAKEADRRFKRGGRGLEDDISYALKKLTKKKSYQISDGYLSREKRRYDHQRDDLSSFYYQKQF